MFWLPWWLYWVSFYLNFFLFSDWFKGVQSTTSIAAIVTFTVLILYALWFFRYQYSYILKLAVCYITFLSGTYIVLICKFLNYKSNDNRSMRKLMKWFPIANRSNLGWGRLKSSYIFSNWNSLQNGEWGNPCFR